MIVDDYIKCYDKSGDNKLSGILSTFISDQPVEYSKNDQNLKNQIVEGCI